VAQQRIQEIQRLIAAEQKDLRTHIRELRPFVSERPPEDFELSTRLQELAERIRWQWNLSVEINVLPPVPRLSRNIAREIYFVVHEALINAVRHAGAANLRAELSFEPGRVRIMVADDGHGFAFQGCYDQDTLSEKKLGPVTLRERIIAMRGTLCIDSQETGARLEITLPFFE